MVAFYIKHGRRRVETATYHTLFEHQAEPTQSAYCNMDASYSDKKVKDINRNGNSSTEVYENSKKWQLIDPSQGSALRTCDSDGPFIMPLVSIPKVEEYSSTTSLVLSGTARKARPGPPVGSVDIGISKCAYFFQVALPGVKKDPGQFSCEVERDGKVHVRGETTTGGKTVLRNSRVYEMKFQQQCPPGPFSLSFCLPGPVDPRLFFPNFRSDGILEAVVMKYKYEDNAK